MSDPTAYVEVFGDVDDAFTVAVDRLFDRMGVNWADLPDIDEEGDEGAAS